MNRSSLFSVVWTWSVITTATWLLAPIARAEPGDELRLDHFLDLRRPDVAKQLALSDEQSVQVGSSFQELTDKLTVLYRKYPRGAQDNEGEAIRQKSRTEFLLAGNITRERLTKLLTPSQLEALQKRTPSVFPPRGLVWMLDRYSPVSPTSRLSRWGVGDLGFTTEQLAAYNGSEYPTIHRHWDDVPALTGPSSEREAVVFKRLAAREQVIRSLLTLEQRRLLEKLEQRDAQRPQPRFHFLLLSQQQREEQFEFRAPLRSADGAYELTQLASMVQLKRTAPEPTSEIVVGHPAVYLICSRAISGDGRFLATAAVTLSPAFEKERERYPRGEIRVWDMQSGELLAVVTSDIGVTTVEFVHSTVLLVRPAGRLSS